MTMCRVVAESAETSPQTPRRCHLVFSEKAAEVILAVVVSMLLKPSHFGT